MAVGDVVSSVQSVAAGAYLSLQPSGTVEWVIHNIAHESDAELHFYDGTNDVIVSTHYGNDAWVGHSFHCRNGAYYRIKNTDTAAKIISYDGVVTHV